MSKKNRTYSTDPLDVQEDVVTTETESSSTPELATVVETPTWPSNPVIPETNTQVTNKEETKVEPKTTTTTVQTVSPAVEKFNTIASRYIELMTSAVITDEIKKKAIITLTNMSNCVTLSNDVEVFEACYQFMLKNRAIMLVPTTVVDGINRFLAKDKITKVVQFYVTFQSLVESKLLHTKFTLNVTTIRRIFNNDALANWLITKR